jgi:ABC-type transport system involved in cytochrome c biogenesis permease subunit
LNTLVLSITTFMYLSAFVLLLISAISGKSLLERIGRLLAYLSFFLQSAGIILRWVESYRAGIGHAPLSNFYESLVFFSWAIILLFLLFARGRERSLIGVFVTAVAFLLMAYASFSPGVDSRIQPLIPALKSNWLIVHVITCFLGYAAFVIASLIGILYLRMSVSAGDPDSLGDMLYRSVAIGFILFTFGIMTGSVWAHVAWGRYWGWDPKETWALITWLIYAAVLHARIREGGVNTRVVAMILIGLVSVLFTYFGVNYLPGLHSYQ